METAEKISIDKERCTSCGLCIPICVRRILVLGDDSARVTEPNSCILCGHCKAVCPEDAFRLGTLDEQEFSPAPEPGDLPRPDKLMAFFRGRRSTRIYQKRTVEREKLLQILEAGRFAPSGGNRQPLQYVVLQSPEAMETVRRMAMSALVERGRRVREATEEKRGRGEALSLMEEALAINAQMWLAMPDLLRQGEDRLFYFAPTVIVCHGDLPSASVEVDAGLAGMQMALMAEALGLGTCFCHFLVFAVSETAALREILQIPEGRKVAFALLLGYPGVTFSRLVSRNPLAAKWV